VADQTQHLTHVVGIFFLEHQVVMNRYEYLLICTAFPPSASNLFESIQFAKSPVVLFQQLRQASHNSFPRDIHHGPHPHLLHLSPISTHRSVRRKPSLSPSLATLASDLQQRLCVHLGPFHHRLPALLCLHDLTQPLHSCVGYTAHLRDTRHVDVR